MKQLFNDLKTGQISIIESPSPKALPKHLNINTSVSLISSGTERMLVEFGQAGLLAKARNQPEKVKEVIQKIRTDGLISTIEAVQSKLSQPLALGYCNVGKIVEVGSDCSDFKIGDRVVSNGHHADLVRVPVNLTAKIPDNVSDKTASFVVVSAIGLQGIRLAKPTLGEAFVVTGVGLIGLLTVQMLRAQGCRVLAIDFDEDKLKIAQKFGAETCNPGKGEDPIKFGQSFSRGKGVDGVIITASTKSNDPVSQAAKMCRQRGRVVLVGVTGLELNRADFYEKEITFQVSCSYGPGRYDPSYEEGGNDYPFGLVRWTEKRNFEAVLDLMSQNQLDVSELASHNFLFENATEAYKVLTEDKKALGILLSYEHGESERQISSVRLSNENDLIAEGKANIGFIGAGNYASRVLIPAFKSANAELHSIASSGGTSGVIHGKRNGFKKATTDTESLISNQEINTVAIVTQHNSHAKWTIEALKAGKNVFVEKPLALTKDELKGVEKAFRASEKCLMVGYNRRFSPLVQTLKGLVDKVAEPKTFVMMMNAGAIPQNHWTQNNKIGGGRIIGEACHHIDLMRFLAGTEIISVYARRMGDSEGVDITEDKASIVLGFADGSFGTIHYLANGGSSFPKERIEVFAAGGTLQLDNFLRLKGFGWPNFSKQNLWRQNKGQTECAKAFIEAVEGGKKYPIPPSELFEVARITIEATEMLRKQ